MEDEYEQFVRNKTTGEILPLGRPLWKDVPEEEKEEEYEDNSDITPLGDPDEYGDSKPTLSVETLKMLLYPEKVGKLDSNVEGAIENLYWGIIGVTSKMLILGNASSPWQLNWMFMEINHVIETSKMNPFLRKRLTYEAAIQIEMVARATVSQSSTFTGDGMNAARLATGLLKVNRTMGGLGEGFGEQPKATGLFNDLKNMVFGAKKPRY